MPSRPVVVAIVAFWLASAGWYVRREILPRFQTVGPPPYAIELVDEAVRQGPPTRWRISRNGQPLGTLRTAVHFDEAADTFTLEATARQLEVAGVGPIKVVVNDYQGGPVVDRAGRLVGITADLTISVLDQKMRAEYAATVADGQLRATARIESPLGRLEPELPPVPMTGVSVLNPLHPVRKITGLRPGQTWVQPLVDPLSEAVRESVRAAATKLLGRPLPLSDAGPRELTATVTGPRALEWNNRSVDCLVIEYAGGDFQARVWVRQSDGDVLRQEADAPGEQLELEREP